jgi:Protein of unknown function (DUF402)
VAFAPGQLVLRRYFRASTYSFVKPMIVAGDDEAGLLLWMPAGTEVAGLRDEDDRTLHAVALDEMREPRLVRRTWGENDVLLLMPPGAAHSVWWFFRRGEFAGWYVNLETPGRRHDEGVDATDLVLDVVVAPDRTWAWKDEDEMADRIGRPHYFDRDGAAAIRAEGERVIKLVEAGAYPFDGTHTDFRPDPSWPAPRLPAGWDRPGPAGQEPG